VTWMPSSLSMLAMACQVYPLACMAQSSGASRPIARCLPTSAASRVGTWPSRSLSLAIADKAIFAFCFVMVHPLCVRAVVARPVGWVVERRKAVAFSPARANLPPIARASLGAQPPSRTG